MKFEILERTILDRIVSNLSDLCRGHKILSRSAKLVRGCKVGYYDAKFERS